MRRLLSTITFIGVIAAASACGSNNAPPGGAAASSGPGIDKQTVATCGDVRDPAAPVVAGTNQQQFSAPEQVVDNGHTYCAILTTEHGRVILQLYPQYAPKNVNNFVFLASKGFYDGVPFHRVIPGFMAQTGDPTGTGAGGPGYDNIPLEVNSPLRYDKPGVVGVARTNDPDSAGSQFFITFDVASFLDNGYTIIGNVVSGMDIVNQIRIRDLDSDPNANSIVPEMLKSVRVVDIGAK